MHGPSPAAEIARSPEAWERLAKEWMVEVIERTPLAEVEELPLGWIAAHAPPLIAEILGQLSDPVAARDLDLPAATRKRAASLGERRASEGAASRLPRDLAALQGLMIDALSRETRDRGDLARTASRLAEVFGAVQAAAMGPQIERHGAQATPATGLAPAGEAELRERLGLLLDGLGANGSVLSLAQLELDGAERIANAFGAQAAARMTEAVTELVRGHLEHEQELFRLSGESFAILSPGAPAAALEELGRELERLVDSAQADGGPRLGLAVGVASFPRHAETPQELMSAAEHAAWEARAAGKPVAVAPNGERGDLQDR